MEISNRNTKRKEGRAHPEVVLFGGEKETAKIVVLVDNYCGREGFETAWGLSLFVSLEEEKFLFDAGPSRGILIRNAKRAGVNLEEVKYVFLSHPHGDHVGGVSAFYPLSPKPKIYVPAGFSARDLQYLRSLGFETEEVAKIKKVGEIKLLSSFGGWIPELVSILPGGVLLTGCSHAGISKIVEEVIERGENVRFIIGGLHTFSSPLFKVKKELWKLFDLGVEKIAPLHCSGRKVIKYLQEKFPEKLVLLGSGSELIL